MELRLTLETVSQASIPPLPPLPPLPPPPPLPSDKRNPLPDDEEMLDGPRLGLAMFFADVLPALFVTMATIDVRQ